MGVVRCDGVRPGPKTNGAQGWWKRVSWTPGRDARGGQTDGKLGG